MVMVAINIPLPLLMACQEKVDQFQSSEEGGGSVAALASSHCCLYTVCDVLGNLKWCVEDAASMVVASTFALRNSICRGSGSIISILLPSSNSKTREFCLTIFFHPQKSFSLLDQVGVPLCVFSCKFLLYILSVSFISPLTKTSVFSFSFVLLVTSFFSLTSFSKTSHPKW